MSVTAKVFNYILKYPGSHVIDIARECKLKLRPTLQALSALMDYEFVMQTNDRTPRYRIVETVQVLDLIECGFQVKIK